ncbi:macrocin-O-methyltransferase TylF [Leeuwenhoekiella aequorea]|uniref:Macrocin-O-methyltransferase TylF n=2 Tax=Leeuwenhoekiella aequorea TaxID=283736 RepID=A0A4V1KRH1_9FLAO|nr:macrocin-O-methyltransferase TylF [Leeuwenhoekiella aequorea]
MIARLKKKIKSKIYSRYFAQNSNTITIDRSESDFEEHEVEIIGRVSPYTMTGALRIVNFIRAVDYIEEKKIEGAIVECGVWKGGSIMAALLELIRKNTSGRREIFLYDTFEGMSEPTEKDWSSRAGSAITAFEKNDESWNRIKCYSSLDEVVKNIKSTGYNLDQVHFIKGKVEETIPKQLPKKIAILRLDTDWYESTKHEMIHLFPLLVKGGILIIDDYGHWEGCKKAVDEYIREHNLKLFLIRVDYTCRITIKS